MYFYIDESGHTGANLFDPVQPTLYYGMLSSKSNLDVLAVDSIKQVRKKLGVDRIHATDLSNARLPQVVGVIGDISKRYDTRFDFYRIKKVDHALICFFDQVFDQGINPAMTWTGYWTPLRYLLLVKLSLLFDENILKRAWQARIQIEDDKAEAEISAICMELIGRLDLIPDKRSRQLIGDCLLWAAQNPKDLSYNCSDSESVLQITPNLIGFQTVLLGVAQRMKDRGKKTARLTVDQQLQFNAAQDNLAQYYAKIRDIPLPNGPGLPKLDFSDVPNTPIKFCSSNDSVGLEIVDTYLWCFKRFFERKPLAPELVNLVIQQFKRGRTDEISLKAIIRRWTPFFEESLPEPNEENLREAQELFARDEKRRLDEVSKLISST